MDTSIRPAVDADWPAIWTILREVIAAGETFAHDAATTEEDARRFWMALPARAYAAVSSGSIVGSFMIRPAQPGRGAHIANAAYIVASSLRGCGIGRSLGEFSLKEATRLGYSGMQFNYVISTNTTAVRLWQSLGFEIMAAIPMAFRHDAMGLVDALVMYRRLDECLST